MFLFGCGVSLVKNSGFLNLVSFMSWSPQRRIPFHTGEVTPSSRHNATFPDQDQGGPGRRRCFHMRAKSPRMSRAFPNGLEMAGSIGTQDTKEISAISSRTGVFFQEQT
jgi:hypothetical protein